MQLVRVQADLLDGRGGLRGLVGGQGGAGQRGGRKHQAGDAGYDCGSDAAAKRHVSCSHDFDCLQ